MATRTGRILSMLFLSSCALALTPDALGQEAELPKNLAADDWTGIRAAYEKGRHAFFAVDHGHRARNPGQQWETRFDGRGFQAVPDSGGWTWGLELESYGFAGSDQVLTSPEMVRARGNLLAYRWDTSLEEWYVNDSRGLEHGYTLRQRPPQSVGRDKGLLTFTLQVRGKLHPEVTSEGDGVRFLDEDSAVVLTYTGLRVFDADGRELEASFEYVADRLRLTADEHGARYPLTIDPLAQQAYLKASNTERNDHFAYSVAVSGNTVVVGAPRESSNATGVNGNQSDKSAPAAGAAYVFVRNGATWIQQAYLKASNTDARDQFGDAVAISGDRVVVGARLEASGATGVNSDENDNSAALAGAAYVFRRNGTSWSQQAYLKASNAEGGRPSYPAGDMFGEAVAVSGDTVVVGAWAEGSAATGVNGDQLDNSAQGSGAAYVFRWSGASWRQEAYLKASNTDPEDRFGGSVSVSGDVVAVGAFVEDSAATGANGDQSDNTAQMAGAAYVFVRSGSSWSQKAYLKASNTESPDQFGYSLSVSDDTLVVGAHIESSNATGVNGDQTDNSAPGAGAAYVFVRSGTTWSQEAYLKASNTDADDNFGHSVAVSGNAVVVGADREYGSATGVNGDQSDNSAPVAGAVYVFVRNGTNWSQDAYLKASNTELGDEFGGSVAVSGDTVIVGAPGEDSAATGVNGDQSDNSAWMAGAAYLFSVPSPGTGYCFGDPGSGAPCPCGNDNDGSAPGSGCANGAFASGAQLTGSGMASVSADTLVLATTGLDPSNTGLYFQANNAVNGGNGNPFGDGLRCAGGGLIRLQVRVANASGTSNTTIAIGAKGGVGAGDVKRYQCWYRDNSGGQPCGPGVNDFNLSNGYEIVWLP